MIAVYKKCLTKALILCLFISFSYTILAVNPGKVEGSVTDAETYKPVPFANVELMKLPDSSMVKVVNTAEDGKYLFEDVAIGKYYLRVSCLGYHKQTVLDFEITPQKPQIKVGPTSLLTESKSLNEVTVVGYKLTGVMEDDKTTYTVNSKAADYAPSSLELLRQLPEVTVGYMSNEVKLAGSSNIIFQVNGKKVDNNFLLQLNPKLVDKIEVLTNPGVKYDSDVDAVINIILKKNMEYGLSGRLRVEVPTGSTIFCGNNASFDFFRKKIRVFAGGNFRLQQFDYESFRTRTNTSESGEETILEQNTKQIITNKRGGFNYGFDWFPDDNNTLNFYSSVRPSIPNQGKPETDIGKGAVHRIGTGTNTDKNQSYDYSLFYKHKFAQKNHDISFEGYYSDRNSLSSSDYYEYEYLNADSLFNQRYQIKETDSKQLTLKIDYNYPITEKLKLAAGYNGNFNQNDYTYEERVSQFSDLTEYDENRQSGYTNISWNISSLNLQAGIRYELSDIDIIHVNDTGSLYHSLLPFVSAQYKLGKKQTFRLNYRKSVNRPGVNQLSPTNYKDDSYSLSVGNPQLTPGNNNRIEFTHRIQLVGPMYVSYRPYVNFISKGIRQVILPSTDSIVRRKYLNVSNDLEYGITLSGTFAFVKWWEISPSYTYYKREMEALPEYGISQTQKYWSQRFNLSSRFMLPKDLVAFIEFSDGSPYYSLQGNSKGNYECVMGFYKSVKKKFNITVVTINPWNNWFSFTKSYNKASGMEERYKEGVHYPYLLILRLGYSFNIGKEGKKLDRQRENDESTDNKKGFF